MVGRAAPRRSARLGMAEPSEQPSRGSGEPLRRSARTMAMRLRTAPHTTCPLKSKNKRSCNTCHLLRAKVANALMPRGPPSRLNAPTPRSNAPLPRSDIPPLWSYILPPPPPPPPNSDIPPPPPPNSDIPPPRSETPPRPYTPSPPRAQSPESPPQMEFNLHSLIPLPVGPPPDPANMPLPPVPPPDQRDDAVLSGPSRQLPNQQFRARSVTSLAQALRPTMLTRRMRCQSCPATIMSAPFQLNWAQIRCLRYPATMRALFPPSRSGLMVNNNINLEFRCYLTLMPFYCGYCYKLPLTPITANCGHTSCQECLRDGKCSCGQEVMGYSIGVNILVQNLLNSISLPTPPESAPPVEETDRSGVWLQKYYGREWSEFPGITSVSPVRRRTRNITKAVTRYWIANEDLDCTLCTNRYHRPITTPCGHTFCRTCLERSLDYNNVCPLCKMTLHWFDIELIKETRFVSAAIEVAALPSTRPAPDPRLPIFACTIAFPMVACPLFVFEPRYRLMLRRCLRGNRHFGMVAPGPNRFIAEYGTLLEIRDCVRLPNGCSLVCTMGVSRFRVLQRGEKDGYAVAEVMTVYDHDTSSILTQRSYLRFLQTLFMEWRQGVAGKEAIDDSFGPMPTVDEWTEADGPAFVWWAASFLPLPDNVKYTMLKRTEAMMRMQLLQRCFQMMIKRLPGYRIRPEVGPIINMSID